MKNKRIVIITILSLLLVFISIYIIRYKDTLRLEGRYLYSQNGTHLIVTNQLSHQTGRYVPFEMICDKNNVFNNLTSGDKIKITIPHQAIMDTYPGYIKIYSCRKLKDGELSDVPSRVLQDLKGLDWVF